MNLSRETNDLLASLVRCSLTPDQYDFRPLICYRAVELVAASSLIEAGLIEVRLIADLRCFRLTTEGWRYAVETLGVGKPAPSTKQEEPARDFLFRVLNTLGPRSLGWLTRNTGWTSSYVERTLAGLIAEGVVVKQGQRFCVTKNAWIKSGSWDTLEGPSWRREWNGHKLLVRGSFCTHTPTCPRNCKRKSYWVTVDGKAVAPIEGLKAAQKLAERKASELPALSV